MSAMRKEYTRMSNIDQLFEDIAAILKNMQSTDKMLAKRIEKIETELLISSTLNNIGSETGI